VVSRKLSGRELILRISDHLGVKKVRSANIDMQIQDVAILNLQIVVDDDLLKAIGCDEGKSGHD